jgi:hypothetical protein
MVNTSFLAGFLFAISEGISEHAEMYPIRLSNIFASIVR